MLSVTLNTYPNTQVLWALRQMRSGHRELKRISGGNFYRLMGSGSGNGFSIWPDLNTYAHLVWWDDRSKAESMLMQDPYMKERRARSSSEKIILLEPTRSKGVWGKQDPFSKNLVPHREGRFSAISRALIKPHLVPAFWRRVPKASENLEGFKGHILSKGIGEYPLFMQATFSVWESKEDMMNFAYKSPQHLKVIELTKELDWFTEQMYLEFNVLDIIIDT